MANSLSIVEQHPAIWRGGNANTPQPNRTPTGYASLDHALRGGIPNWGVIRLRHLPGTGELSFLSALLKNRKQTLHCAFVNPPGIILAPWLKQLGVNPAHALLINTDNELAKWATETCVRSSACHVVFMWVTGLTVKQARRLQVAAQNTQCQVFLFESLTAARRSLPVSLDLSLQPTEQGFSVEVHKQLAGWSHQQIPVYFGYTPNNNILAKVFRLYASPTSTSLNLQG